jgi:hypothetical protein
MLTADQIVDQALGRVGEIGGTYPSARGPMWRRIGHHQRSLFAKAAKVNPERFGVCAISALQTVLGSRVVDLSDMSTVPTPETIQRVEVHDKGTSAYVNGDIITIVTPEDMAAELPPRAMLRDRLIVGVSTDLALVTSVKVYYSRLPDLFALTDKDKVVELEAPWDTLLECDLAVWLVQKATQLAADIRAAAIASFTAEHGALLAEFLQHVAEYGPAVSRFSSPRVHTRL